MKNIILNILEESIDVKKRTVSANVDLIIKGAERIAECISTGRKLMLFGNGGSAADSQHLAAEFINRFQMERRPLAALALTVDTSVITSIGNDYSFDDIFSKQVRALGQKGDIALGISTSGGSRNVIKAISAASDMGIFTMGFTGRGGTLADCADLVFPVLSDSTARIQETHIFLGHALCDLVERIIFP